MSKTNNAHENCLVCHKTRSEHRTLEEMVADPKPSSEHIFIGTHNARMFGLKVAP